MSASSATWTPILDDAWCRHDVERSVRDVARVLAGPDWAPDTMHAGLADGNAGLAVFHDQLARSLKDPDQSILRDLRWNAAIDGLASSSYLGAGLFYQLGPSSSYATADDLVGSGAAWIETQWLRARVMAEEQGHSMLALDEIQKIPRWSETVKRLYDEDGALGVDLRVLLLGSSALLVQQGLEESLAGRYERMWMGHWSWPEMHEAFDIGLNGFVRFGGNPGAMRKNNRLFPPSLSGRPPHRILGGRPRLIGRLLAWLALHRHGPKSPTFRESGHTSAHRPSLLSRWFPHIAGE